LVVTVKFAASAALRAKARNVGIKRRIVDALPAYYARDKLTAERGMV